MAKVGRNTKKTPERLEKILELLRAGNTHNVAYTLAGISHQTFHDWINTDQEFSEAVKKAEAHAHDERVAQIATAAAGGSWQAAAWWLERRHRDVWGRVDKTELSGLEGRPIQTQEVVDDAAILAVAAAITAAAARETPGDSGGL